MDGDKDTQKLSKKIVSQGQKKPTPRQKVKQEKVQNYLKNCVSKMKTKQDKLMTQHKFGEKSNKFVLYPERNSFFLFDKETKKVFFKAKFQIIGTYSEKSKTWRWAWSNRYVPYDLKQTALKIKKFGEANSVEMLSDPKIKNEDMGLIFTALGMDLSRSNGYYIVPGTKVYPTIYLIFTQVSKINDTYEEVVSQMKANHRANHKLMRDKLKEVKVKKQATLVSKKSKDKESKKPNTSKTKDKVVKPPKKISKPKNTKTQTKLKKKKITTPKTTKKVLNPNTKIHIERTHKVKNMENGKMHNLLVKSNNDENGGLTEITNDFSPMLANEDLGKKQILIPVKTRTKKVKKSKN